jgi:hypothetical protein
MYQLFRLLPGVSPVQPRLRGPLPLITAAVVGDAFAPIEDS